MGGKKKERKEIEEKEAIKKEATAVALVSLSTRSVV